MTVVRRIASPVVRPLVRAINAAYGISSAFTPARLFTTGVNGAWYDPSDYSTLYRDAAGTLPVTAVEQPVGLMLDKSKGLVLGPELVTNGDFSNGTTGWTAFNAVISNASNTLKVDDSANAGFNSSAVQQLSLTPGKWYKLTVDVVSTDANGWNFSLSPNATSVSAAQMLASGTTAGTKIVHFLASTNIYLYISVGGTGISYFDNISVRELPGNHAFNSSGNSANFPVLSARYNLLTKTEQFDDATVWERASGNGGSVPVVTPDYEAGPFAGTLADRVQLVRTTQTGSFSQLSVLVTSLLTVGVTYIASVWMKSRSGSAVVDMGSFNGAYGGYKPTVTTEWQRFSYQWTVTSTASRFGPLLFQTTGTSETADLLIWGADLRVANDALNQPAYQRVNTATDYDTVGFKPYLRFNGTNQRLQTNSIDFSYGDKMFVSAGVRKLSDAATGVVFELSANTSANAGAIQLVAPGSGGTDKYRITASGSILTSAGAATTSATYNAPVTNVASGLASISTDQQELRLNGASAATKADDLGTGNYGNYQMFVGARAGTSLWFNGRLYQMVVAGKQASAAEITSTETYINQKTGAY